MSKTIVISERDNIAAVMENSKVCDFFIHRGDVLLGDVYLASVENILPSIDAAFVHVGSDKMGFLHASDVVGKGALTDKLKPKQKILVQVVKEPTGHKGPRVTMALSIPGRFLVLMPDEKGVSISRKIVSPKERSRLKSIVSLLKPAGVGVIIRTEAEGQSEAEIQEDIEFLLEKWNTLVTAADTVEPPSLVSRDQDLLYRVIREACTEDISEIIVDTPFALQRANQLLQSWNMNQNIKVSAHKGMEPLLVAKNIDKEIRSALQTKVNLPSGGYLFIQQTEAMSVIDVNSGKFTSSATQGETIRKTNLEAVTEVARQLRLRNIGGMIIIDFIDMDNRIDKLSILEELEMALEPDKSKPQVGQLSDLGLVELTRHRQGQSLSEMFSRKCPACSGSGIIIEGLNFASSPQESEYKAKASKLKLPQMKPMQQNQQNQQKKPHQHQNNQNRPQERRIPTTPSLNASPRPEPVEATPSVELDVNSLKEAIETTGKTYPISSAVRFGAVPPNVINKHVKDENQKDISAVLPQVEKSENDKVEQPQKPQQHQPQRHAHTQRHQRPQQQFRNDEMRHQRPEQKQEVRQEIKPEQQPEIRQEIRQEIKPEIKQEMKPEVQKTVERVQPIAIKPVTVKTPAAPKPEEKLTEKPAEKKVVRRGRPKAAPKAVKTPITE